MKISETDLQRLKREIIEELTYFSAHLPFQDRDDTTVVLKGHLLLEEQLVTYVGSRLINPQKIDRFTFDQYLRLAEAFNGIESFEWIFEASRKLNRIRNTISHQLSPSGVEEAISDFVTYVSSDGRVQFPAEFLTCNRPELRMAIFAVYAALRNLNRKPFRSLMISALETSNVGTA